MSFRYLIRRKAQSKKKYVVEPEQFYAGLSKGTSMLRSSVTADNGGKQNLVTSFGGAWNDVASGLKDTQRGIRPEDELFLK